MAEAKHPLSEPTQLLYDLVLAARAFGPVMFLVGAEYLMSTTLADVMAPKIREALVNA